VLIARTRARRAGGSTYRSALVAVLAVPALLLGACADAGPDAGEPEATGSPATVSDVVLANLGRCVHDVIVLRGSEPASAQVFTTSRDAVDAAMLGGGPAGEVADSGDRVYVVWVEGDPESTDVVLPGTSGEIVAEYVVVPVASISNAPVDPSLPCPVESTGVATSDWSVNLELLGEPTPLPLALVAPPGSPPGS
jgi:hypothetical protein